MLLGSAPVEWAVFRLARLPERRERLLARGGDAFALAEALRADPAEPAALVVLEPGLLAIAEDCGADEQARRRGLVERCAREAGAELETLDDAGWLAAVRRTAARAPCAWPRATRASRCPRTTGAWAYDAGRRLALVDARCPRGARARRARRSPRAPSSSRRVLGRGGRVTALDLTDARRERFDALARQCVSCGLCLPSCPTFDLLAAESDGPRGRIHIMQRLVAGDLSVEEGRGPLDRCLGCRACEVACPSEVQYGEMLEIVRDGGAQTPLVPGARAALVRAAAAHALARAARRPAAGALRARAPRGAAASRSTPTRR